MSSRNCSRLYSDFKALCEACRHSKAQVRSAHSSDLIFFTLSFCLESIYENVYIVCSVFSSMFPLHTVIHTQPYAYMAYLRNKLWTIETSNLVTFLPCITHNYFFLYSGYPYLFVLLILFKQYLKPYGR